MFRTAEQHRAECHESGSVKERTLAAQVRFFSNARRRINPCSSVFSALTALTFTCRGCSACPLPIPSKPCVVSCASPHEPNSRLCCQSQWQSILQLLSWTGVGLLVLSEPLVPLPGLVPEPPLPLVLVLPALALVAFPSSAAPVALPNPYRQLPACAGNRLPNRR